MKEGGIEGRNGRNMEGWREARGEEGRKYVSSAIRVPPPGSIIDHFDNAHWHASALLPSAISSCRPCRSGIAGGTYWPIFVLRYEGRPQLGNCPFLRLCFYLWFAILQFVGGLAHDEIVHPGCAFMTFAESVCYDDRERCYFIVFCSFF